MADKDSRGVLGRKTVQAASSISKGHRITVDWKGRYRLVALQGWIGETATGRGTGRHLHELDIRRIPKQYHAAQEQL
jgi:hypothetical protein